MFLGRAGEKPEQFAMDTHPSDRSAHQQQQPQPTPSWNRQAPSPSLPELVVQQTTQLASRTWQHGVSQVEAKRTNRNQVSPNLKFCHQIKLFSQIWMVEIMVVQKWSNGVKRMWSSLVFSRF